MPRTRNVASRPHTTKHPLQDITDRYVPISAVNRPPTPRPTGKAKIPAIRAFGAPTLSSLPPSSPPSASSTYPDPVAPALSAKHSPQSDVENVPPEMILRSISPEAGSAHSPSSDRDPFGFFAVERKLKALRAQQDRQLQYRGVRPAQIDTVFKPDIVTPPTPHKPHKKRQAIASPSGSRTNSLPSTPSPSKPISNKGKARATSEDADNGAGDCSLETTSTTPLAAAQRRRVVKRTRKEDGKEEGTSLARKQSVLRATTIAKKTENGPNKGDKLPRKKRGKIPESNKVSRPKTQAKEKVKPIRNAAKIDYEQQEVRLFMFPFLPISNPDQISTNRNGIGNVRNDWIISRD